MACFPAFFCTKIPFPYPHKEEDLLFGVSWAWEDACLFEVELLLTLEMQSVNRLYQVLSGVRCYCVISPFAFQTQTNPYQPLLRQWGMHFHFFPFHFFSNYFPFESPDFHSAFTYNFKFSEKNFNQKSFLWRIKLDLQWRHKTWETGHLRL